MKPNATTVPSAITAEVLNACTEAFTAQFAQAHTTGPLLQFCDDAIPDMYDHNYCAIHSTDAAVVRSCIAEALASARADGKTFCDIRIEPGVYSPSLLPQGPDAPRPNIEHFLLCAAPIAELTLPATAPTGAQVRQVATRADARRRTQVELTAYADAFGAGFCRRKGRRNALVYLAPHSPLTSFVCFSGKTPVGKADLLIHNGIAMLEDVDTVPAYQRRGYGGALLATMCRHAAATGCHTAFLVTDADGTAKQMYQKLGFATQLPGRTRLFFAL